MRKIREITNNRYILYSFAISILVLLAIVSILLSYLFYQSKNVKLAFNDNYVRIDTKQIKAYQKTEPSIITAIIEERCRQKNISENTNVEKRECVKRILNKGTSIATSEIKRNAVQEVISTKKEDGKEVIEDKEVEKRKSKTLNQKKSNNNIVVKNQYRGYQATRVYRNS